MSVPLKEERRSELPLIIFTTCVPAAEGLTLCALAAGWGAGAPASFLVNLLPNMLSSGMAAAVAFILTTVGMLASIAHLAKPLRAPRSLANLASSWLSREIAFVGAFWALLALWALGAAIGASALALAAQAGAAAVGAGLMWVIARAYRVSTRPAWCGSEGLIELWAGALGAGSALALLTCANSSALFAALMVGLAVLGLLLDVHSHRHRKARLQTEAVNSDERIPLTLNRYEKLAPHIKALWIAEGICVVVMAVCAALALPLPIMALVSAGQLAVHGMHRNVFYELPIQVRHLARLKK